MCCVYYVTNIAPWLKQDTPEPRQHFMWPVHGPLCSATLELSSCPCPPVCHLRALSNLQMCSYFTGLPFGWLARNPQWPNIPLNSSQVWALTREVKSMHRHSDWLPPSCFWCFSGAVGWSCTGVEVAPRPSLIKKLSEGKQASISSLLQPRAFSQHYQWLCWAGNVLHAISVNTYTESDVFPPFSFLLSRSRLSAFVLWLWLQVITLHYLGSHSSFVGPVRSLPIWSPSCLVTVKRHSASACTYWSPARGKAKRKTASLSFAQAGNNWLKVSSSGFIHL